VPGKFHPGWPGANDDECQKRRTLPGIGFAFRALKGKQHASADGHGIFQRFQAWRERLPFRMAEIGMARPRRENERVVKRAAAAFEHNTAAICVHANHRCKKRGHFWAAPHEKADWPGDFRRRQRRRRDLVK